MLKKIIVITLSLLLVVSMAVPSLAWFAQLYQYTSPKITAATPGAYFGGGDGTEGSPFVISTPTHLYNLAWLQYIGYFNDGPINNGKGGNPTYFKLTADIDMSKESDIKALPPIGTTQYPFIGNFDGGGHTISNVVTTNAKTAFTGTDPQNQGRLPSTSEFEVNNLLSEYLADTDEVAQVMGFFGTVGGGTAENQVKNFALSGCTVHCYSDTTTIGIIAGEARASGTTDDPKASVTNVATNGCTLTIAASNALLASGNVSDHALIGHCAYQVSINNGTVTVYDPTITNVDIDTSGGGGTEAAWGGSIAMNVIDETLDRYLTNSQSYTYTYMKTLVTRADGASVILNVKTSDAYKYYSGTTASVVFQESSLGTKFLAGGCFVNTFKYSETTTEVPSYKIYYGSDYLNANATIDSSNDDVLSLSTGTSANSTDWIYSNGYLYAVIDQQAFFLNASADGLSLSRMPKTQWTLADGQFSCTIGTSVYILCYSDGAWMITSKDEIKVFRYITTTVGTTTYYLTADYDHSSRTGFYVTGKTNRDEATLWEYEGSSYKTHNGAQYFYLRAGSGMVSLMTTEQSGWSYDEDSNKLKFNSYYVTFDSKYSVTEGSDADAVTYFVGWSANTSSTNAAQITLENPSEGAQPCSVSASDTKNDLEVEATDYKLEFDSTNSTYVPLQNSEKNTGYIIGGIASAVQSDGTLSEQGADIRIDDNHDKAWGTTDKVYVINSDGKFKQISLEPPESSVDNDAELRKSFSNLTNSVESYKSAIGITTPNSRAKPYGIHFMDAGISKDTTVRIASGYLDGIGEISDYEMPADCIDFRVAQAGLITFYAASLYGGNDCFFSLHKIVRDSNGKITEIKEIKEIYLVPGTTETYEYVYADDSSDSDKTITYDRKFETKYLTNPTEYLGEQSDQLSAGAFYFEVPVNAGEYALGSVKDKTGAYLIYLDLCANGNAYKGDRVIINEYITESASSQSYAPGVGLGTLSDITDANGVVDEIVSIKVPAGVTSLALGTRENDTVNATYEGTAPTVNVQSGVHVNSLSQGGTQSTVIIKRVTVIDTGPSGTQTAVFLWRSDTEQISHSGNATNVSTNAGVTTFTMSGDNSGEIAWANITETTAVLTFGFTAEKDNDYAMSYSTSTGKVTYAIVVNNGTFSNLVKGSSTIVDLTNSTVTATTQ